MKKTQAKVEIDVLLCKGCGLCVVVCPKRSLAIGPEPTAQGFFPAVVLDEGACTACAACGAVCPEAAITITVETDARPAAKDPA